MLIATPYRDFDIRDKSPPRIISEIRKNCTNCCTTPTNLRPRLSGDLLLKCGSDKKWWPRRVLIRGGQLLVSSGHHCPDGPNSLRLPLRHLSLQAGPLPNSLSLCRGQHIVLTLQTACERLFDEWVKTIAIELIRQTPIDAIKYLDILTIADCWRKDNKYEKDWNYNIVNSLDTSYESCTSSSDEKPPQSPTTTEDIDTDVETTPPNGVQHEPVAEKDVEDLLKKCQNVENYVPVKEKLFLFESLCKMGRKVKSSEDVSLRRQVNTSCNKRARSMHDLSNLNTHIAVREICKYFENKTNTKQETGMKNSKVTRRLIFTDNVKKC